MAQTVALPIDPVDRAYRRLAPKFKRIQQDTEKFIVDFEKEWAALKQGDRKRFADKWGWSYDHCSCVANTGLKYPKKKQIISNSALLPKLPDSIASIRNVNRKSSCRLTAGGQIQKVTV